MGFIFDNFEITKKIGKGGYGKIYEGKNLKTGEHVAVKIEVKTDSLSKEKSVYELLGHSKGFASMKNFDSDGNLNILVMDLLGNSLEKVFRLCSRKFSLKTVLLLAQQLLNRLEHLHGKNIIHRDIKPSNFVFGVGETRNQIHLIDFGLAKKHRDGHVNQKDEPFCGTKTFSSINTHLERGQSRRDDLESLGYVLIYLATGALPWEEETATEIHSKIVKKKQDVENEVKDVPEVFLEYLKYCRNLNFEETPDYSKLRQLFKDLFSREGFVDDNAFEWDALKADKLLAGDNDITDTGEASGRRRRWFTDSSELEELAKHSRRRFYTDKLCSVFFCFVPLLLLCYYWFYVNKTKV